MKSYLPVIEPDDAGANYQSLLHIVRNYNRCKLPLPLQLRDHLKNRISSDWVKASGWFVEEDHFRIGDQGSCNR
jgi:hypothetical protein